MVQVFYKTYVCLLLPRVQRNRWRTIVHGKCRHDCERKNVPGLGIEFSSQSYVSQWRYVCWRKCQRSWEQMPQSSDWMECRSLVLYNGSKHEMGTVRCSTLSYEGWVCTSGYYVCRIHADEITKPGALRERKPPRKRICSISESTLSVWVNIRSLDLDFWCRWLPKFNGDFPIKRSTKFAWRSDKFFQRYEPNCRKICYLAMLENPSKNPWIRMRISFKSRNSTVLLCPQW